MEIFLAHFQVQPRVKLRRERSPKVEGVSGSWRRCRWLGTVLTQSQFVRCSSEVETGVSEVREICAPLAAGLKMQVFPSAGRRESDNNNDSPPWVTISPCDNSKFRW